MLSVVAQQVKQIQHAKSLGVTEYIFDEELIKIRCTCNIFITIKVLQLIKLPTSESSTHSVLKVIENLHRLDLLDIPVSPQGMGPWAALNNPLAQLLLYEAKNNFMSSKTEKTKMLLTCAC